MFWNRKSEIKKGKMQTFVYDGFSLFDEKDGWITAKDSAACACEDGVLRSGLGTDTFFADGKTFFLGLNEEKTKGVYFFDFVRNEAQLETKKAVFCHDTDGVLYRYDVDGERTEIDNIGNVIDFAVATNRVMEMRVIFVGENACFEAWPDGVIQPIRLTDLLPVACACKNRIFLVQKPNRLMYSEAGDPWDFSSTIDGGGSLRLPTEYGKVVALVNLEEVVYVFFERGISRFEADAAARNFKMKPIAYSGGEIFAGSVGVFGKGIVFLAADGVYRFDGNKAEKGYKKLNIQPKRTGQVCVQATCNNQYLLSYTDVNKGEVTLVLHADGEQGYFTWKILGLTGCDGRAICNTNGILSEVIEGGEVLGGCYFDCGSFDFGSKERKLLRKLRFTGEGTFSCIVENDTTIRSNEFTFVDGVAEWTLKERGRTFNVSFMLREDAKIRSMTAEVESL